MSSETLLEAKEAAPSQPKRSRKKVCTDWPEEATVKLISAVESQEALWNPSIKAYRNRSLRDSIWTSIAANNLGGQFAVDEVVAKWSNLRVQFRSCETRLKTTKSGQGANENSVHWKFFKSMLFISGANLEKAAESISNLEHQASDLSPLETSTNSTSTPKVKYGNRKPRRTQNDEGKAVALNGLERALKVMDNTDSYQIFGNYVASELRRLPNDHANRVQRKIARFLLDCLEEIDEAENQLQAEEQGELQLQANYLSLDESQFEVEALNDSDCYVSD